MNFKFDYELPINLESLKLFSKNKQFIILRDTNILFKFFIDQVIQTIIDNSEGVVNYNFTKTPIIKEHRNVLLKLKENELFPSLNSIYKDIVINKDIKISGSQGFINLLDFISEDSIVLIFSEFNIKSYDIIYLLKMLEFNKSLESIVRKIYYFTSLDKKHWNYTHAEYLNETIKINSLINLNYGMVD